MFIEGKHISNELIKLKLREFGTQVVRVGGGFEIFPHICTWFGLNPPYLSPDLNTSNCFYKWWHLFCSSHVDLKNLLAIYNKSVWNKYIGGIESWKHKYRSCEEEDYCLLPCCPSTLHRKVCGNNSPENLVLIFKSHMRPHWKLTQLYTNFPAKWVIWESQDWSWNNNLEQKEHVVKMSRSLLSLGTWDRRASRVLMAPGLSLWVIANHITHEWRKISYNSSV